MRESGFRSTSEPQSSSMNSQEQASELLKAAPPLTITGMTIFGFPVSDYVLLLTAIYTIFQICVLVKKFLAAPPEIQCADRYDCPKRVAEIRERQE